MSIGLICLIWTILRIAAPSTPSIKASWRHYDLPTISFQPTDTAPIVNASRVALLIEDRVSELVAPTITHFMSVLPRDWKFVFLGSPEAVDHLDTSAVMRRSIQAGQLEAKLIPSNMTVAGREEISQFLTDLWVYEVLLAPAEWLLLYQTDSIMCGKAASNLNSWLHFDYVGASWNTESRYGGNGGLSLRKVSSVIRILRSQKRLPGSEFEDSWVTERLGHLVGGRVANGTEELGFSADGVWSDDVLPMGYHTGFGGSVLNGNVYGTPAKREKVFGYCPDLKMVVPMDAEVFFGGRYCRTVWK
ncbi:uncharacterized protein HMPREF1541_05427 [Cyphellophora europaea CBS 101466]|uniref:DUF5672 domain-containing protein n=1 Tax=Cyphellophora europaea (strain CBS 101466) TaxID=1220924 RepID=W2RU04_CYPE1|nr:uncharacterized protein HMPREF1541_05427 [Cyphellophora europaea CBS 101466]ETN39204.1 hypothetical protein HMPREF1541_05427 [Cyphellophora europaea CBS 101466]